MLRVMADANRSRGIQGLIERVHHFLNRELWDIELAGLPALRAVGVRAARILSLAWQGMVQSDCLTRASALTYISVLSLVPLLAFGFSVAKGFGAYEYLVQQVVEPALDQLAPATADGVAQVGEAKIQLRDAAEDVLDFVNRTNFATLGLVGLTILLFTSLKLMTQIEATFNVIWGVEKQALRRGPVWTMVKRLLTFAAVLGVGLLLLLSMLASALIAGFAQRLSESFPAPGLVLQVFAFVAFLVVLTPIIALLFKVLPQTSVRWRDLWLGSALTALLFSIGKLGIGLYLGLSASSSAFGAAGAFVVLLLWIYYSALILLFGAEFTWFYATRRTPGARPSAHPDSNHPSIPGT